MKIYRFCLGFFFISLCLHAHFDQPFDQLFWDNQERARLRAIVAILEGEEEGEIVDLPHHKIYLDPHKIKATNCGLFYIKKCEKIFLPLVFSDQFGCFLRCTWEDLAALSDIEGFDLWWCRGCWRLRKMDKFGCCCRCGRRFEECFRSF